jgi:hypothetical protein
MDLQRRHYKIIDDNANNASIQQVSLAALHKLNVTLSNYYDIVPSLTAGQKQKQTTKGNGKAAVPSGGSAMSKDERLKSLFQTFGIDKRIGIGR